MINLLNSFAENWMTYFGTVILQNTLFLAVIFLALYYLREKSASVQYAVAALGLIKLLIPPFVPFTIREAATAASSVGSTAVGDIAYTSTNNVVSAPSLSLGSIILLLWASTVILMLSATFLSTLKLRWHLRKAQFISRNEIDGKTVDIFRSENISVPMSVGLFPKKVYVPELWDSLSAELKHSLLRHEVAHIKRKDGLLGALQTLAQALYFFHPLVWMLTGKANEFREMACDDMAVDNSEVTPIVYSRCLVHVAEHMLPSWSCSSASTLIKQKNKLYTRVNYQVKDKQMKKLNKNKSRLIWTLLLLLIVPLSWYCKQADAVPAMNKKDTGKIYGKVLDEATGEALVGANIIVLNTSQGAASNEKGDFFISGLEEGKHSIRCSMIGYSDISLDDIDVNKSISYQVNFKMEAAAITADKIVVIANPSLSPKPTAPQEPKENGIKGQIEVIATMEVDQFVEHIAPKSGLNETQVETILKGENEVKFIPYDVPPTPIGGQAAIAKSVRYPKKEMDAGIEGQVIVQALIGVDGHVKSAKVLRGVPNTGLDKAAEEAIKKVKFTPAKQRDKDVEVWITLPITFKLDEPESLDVKFIPYDQPPVPIDGMESIANYVVYPEKAKEAGLEGTVLVQAKIGIDGNVEETKVLKGVPNSGFDKAAKNAIKQVKFHPAKQRDKDVAVWITIPVQFKLDE